MHSPDVSVKYVPGKDPVAIFYDANNNEVEKVPLAKLKEAQIETELQVRSIFWLHSLISSLQQRGFTKQD